MLRAVLAAVAAWLFLQAAIVALASVNPGLTTNLPALASAHALVLGLTGYLVTTTEQRQQIVSGFAWQSVVWGAIIGVALKLPADLVRSFVEVFYPSDPVQLSQQAELLRHDTYGQVILLFLVIGGTGPLFEELFYRGVVFSHLASTRTLLTANWISSLLFTLAHASPRDWPSLLGVALTLGALRSADGYIWAAVGAHAAFNSATVAAVVVGIQGVEGGQELPYGWAVVSAALVVVLLTLRRRRT